MDGDHSKSMRETYFFFSSRILVASSKRSTVLFRVGFAGLHGPVSFARASVREPAPAAEAAPVAGAAPVSEAAPASEATPASEAASASEAAQAAEAAPASEVAPAPEATPAAEAAPAAEAEAAAAAEAPPALSFAGAAALVAEAFADERQEMDVNVNSLFPKGLRRVLVVKSLRCAQLKCIEKVDSEMHRGVRRARTE